MFVLCAAAIEALTVHTAKSSDRLKCSTNRFNQTFTSRCRTHTQKRFNIIHREKEIFICTEGDCCSQRLRCCLAGWSRDCECDTPVITTTKWPSRKHATLTMTFNFGWRKTRACRRWKEDKQLSSTMRPAGMISAKNPIASLWCSHSSTTMVSPTFFFFHLYCESQMWVSFFQIKFPMHKIEWTTEGRERLKWQQRQQRWQQFIRGITIDRWISVRLLAGSVCRCRRDKMPFFILKRNKKYCSNAHTWRNRIGKTATNTESIVNCQTSQPVSGEKHVGPKKHVTP